MASVKLNPACGPRRGGGSPGTPGRIHLECQTVLGLMMTAYGVFADGTAFSPRIADITGGPGWIASDTYDIAATAGRDTPFEQMAGPMLRALLERRFQLKVHRETKEAAVYFLTVAKGGPNLEATKEGGCVPIDPNHPPAPGAAPSQARPYCGNIMMQAMSIMKLTAHGVTLKQVAEALLTGMVDRPVIDRTGLSGQYDIQIEFAPEGADLDAPSIFEALQVKLGLKLEPGRGPVESLIVDRVERPTEN